MKEIELQPYERAVVYMIAMTPELSEKIQRSMIIRYAAALDRPLLERAMLKSLELFHLEQRKAMG